MCSVPVHPSPSGWVACESVRMNDEETVQMNIVKKANEKVNESGKCIVRILSCIAMDRREREREKESWTTWHETCVSIINSIYKMLQHGNFHSFCRRDKHSHTLEFVIMIQLAKICRTFTQKWRQRIHSRISKIPTYVYGSVWMIMFCSHANPRKFGVAINWNWSKHTSSPKKRSAF